MNINLNKIACSQTLYFLFKVHRARVIKNKNRGGFIDRQRKGVGVALACSPRSRGAPFSKAVFRKNEKKDKTASGYRVITKEEKVLLNNQR